MIPSLTFMASSDERVEMFDFLCSFVRPGARLLDVGCGDGAFVGFALRRGIHARGVDYDSENVARAEEHGWPVRCVDATQLDPSERYDVITLVHLIEHFPPDAARDMVAALARNLEPRGRMVIMTPNMADWTVNSHIFWLDPTHVRPYPPELLCALLRSAGLETVLVSKDTLVRFGLKQRLARPLGRLRFGPDFQRMNLTVVGQLPVN